MFTADLVDMVEREDQTMEKGFYVYKRTQDKYIKQYWHRQDGKWTYWFSRHCLYPTNERAHKKADELVKDSWHCSHGDVIGTREF